MLKLSVLNLRAITDPTSSMDHRFFVVILSPCSLIPVTYYHSKIPQINDCSFYATIMMLFWSLWGLNIYKTVMTQIQSFIPQLLVFWHYCSLPPTTHLLWYSWLLSINHSARIADIIGATSVKLIEIFVGFNNIALHVNVKHMSLWESHNGINRRRFKVEFNLLNISIDW